VFIMVSEDLLVAEDPGFGVSAPRVLRRDVMRHRARDGYRLRKGLLPFLVRCPSASIWALRERSRAWRVPR